MRTYWNRKTAMLGLLLAIFSDLRRRAWWLGRRSAFEAAPHPTTLPAARPVEQLRHVPQVGWLWRSVAERALPVQTLTEPSGSDGRLLPSITIDVTARPDIADLPRVLATEARSESQPSVGANWLADPGVSEVVLVLTFVEPITCTWAISFDLPRCQALLRQVADGQVLYVAWTQTSASPDTSFNQAQLLSSKSPHGLQLQIGRADTLRVILDQWSIEHKVP